MQTVLKKKPELKIKSASRDISLDAVKFFCNYRRFIYTFMQLFLPD